MDQRRSPFSLIFHVVVTGLLLAIGLAGVATEHASAADGDGTISIVVHSCPPGYTGTTDQQFLIKCTEETGLYGVPLELALPSGTTSFLYSQPNGSGAALPMTLGGIGAGALTISEVSSALSAESVVFCSILDEDGLPVIESAQFPVLGGSIAIEFDAGWAASCDWYRYPTDVATDTATPVGQPAIATETPESDLTLNLHSCPDDFVGSDYTDFIDTCTSETGLYGVPMQVIWPEQTGGTLYSQPNDDGTAVPMQFSTNASWPAESSLTIAEIYTPRLHDPRLFCSQTAGGGSQILDDEEVSIADLVAAIPVTPGDTLTCDWFRFPGESSGIATQDLGAGDGTIVVNKWICDQADIDALGDQAPVAGTLDTLKDACQYAEQPVSFFLDKQYILALDGETTVGVAWADLFPGEHTVEEFNIPGFGQPTVICEGNVPGRKYIQPNIFAMEVTDLEITYDLTLDETLTCDWFNVRTGQSGTAVPATPETSGTPTRTSSKETGKRNADDEITPEATVEHNGNDVSLTSDSDGDGLLDEDETRTYGTNPEASDTDGDGLSDFDEIMLDTTNPLQADTDGDGLFDEDEVTHKGTDPLNVDTDGDGASDGAEVNSGTDPLKP
jgi:hypothetical protein